MPTLRVNLLSQVNNADIRHETYNGREHIVVPSYTLPNDVVMNRGLYPAEEIDKSYHTLEGTLAPLGHPMLDGEYIPATSPAAINANHVGAFNKNVKRVGNRVYVEKWIDVDRANESENGRRLLSAINEKQPIQTSTGVILQRIMVEGNAEYDWVAQNMKIDHDAILLDEEAAATPEQGVGMMVNTADAKLVKNLSTDSFRNRQEQLEQAVKARFGAEDKWVYVEDFDTANVVYSNDNGAFQIGYTIEDGKVTLTGEPVSVQRKTNWMANINKVLQLFHWGVRSEALQTNTEESEMPMTDEEKAALAANIAEAVEAKLSERLNAMEANQSDLAKQITANKSAEEAEKRAIVAEKLGDVVANSLSGEALDEAVAKFNASPNLLGGLQANQNTVDYDSHLPE
jgi:hypothetical protein